MTRAFLCTVALLMLQVAIAAAATHVVGTITEFTTTATAISPGDTLLLRDGTYSIQSYGVAVRTDRVVIRSLSGDRDKVIVAGAGMNGAIDHGFWVSADNVTIRDLTIRNVRYHCIQTDINTDSLKVINCVLRDGGEQLLKVPFSADEPSPSEGGLVEGCLFDFSAGVAARGYTGGIDCHFAKNWIVRNNLFKYIRSPEDAPAEHAIHFWTNSENTLVENNVIIDCDRGIGFGLGDVPHQGGIIRNNMIYHRAIGGNDNADAGIILETCADARVYNNTVYFENDYPNAIEYRFTATTGVVIANNLTNKAVRARDGATGTLSANVTAAQAGWFRAPSTGDLHLSSRSPAAVIDQGITVEGLTGDIDGNARPQGSGIDIGADEFTDAGIHAGSWSRSIRSGPVPYELVTMTRPGSVRRSTRPGSGMHFDLSGRFTITPGRASGVCIVLVNR